MTQSENRMGTRHWMARKVSEVAYSQLHIPPVLEPEIGCLEQAGMDWSDSHHP
jgi:hypothetical protein